MAGHHRGHRTRGISIEERKLGWRDARCSRALRICRVYFQLGFDATCTTPVVGESSGFALARSYENNAGRIEKLKSMIDCMPPEMMQDPGNVAGLRAESGSSQEWFSRGELMAELPVDGIPRPRLLR